MYKILKDFRGSPDGSHVVSYAAGSVVELTSSLAAVAVAEGWAVAEGEAESSAPARKSRKKDEGVAS